MMHRDGSGVIPKLLSDHFDSIGIMQDLSVILSEHLNKSSIEQFVYVVVLSVRASKHQDIMGVMCWVRRHSNPPVIIDAFEFVWTAVQLDFIFGANTVGTRIIVVT